MTQVIRMEFMADFRIGRIFILYMLLRFLSFLPEKQSAGRFIIPYNIFLIDTGIIPSLPVYAGKKRVLPVRKYFCLPQKE